MRYGRSAAWACSADESVWDVEAVTSRALVESVRCGVGGRTLELRRIVGADVTGSVDDCDKVVEWLGRLPEED